MQPKTIRTNQSYTFAHIRTNYIFLKFQCSQGIHIQPAGPTQRLAPRFSCGSRRVGTAVGFFGGQLHQIRARNVYQIITNHSPGMSWSRKKKCYVNLMLHVQDLGMGQSPGT